MSKVCELEKVNSENQKIIDKLTTDNTNLQDELDKTELLNNHMITFDRKSIQYDTNLKLLNQQPKIVGVLTSTSTLRKLSKLKMNISDLAKL